MKKKSLIIASLLGAAGLIATATAVTIVASNNVVKVQEANYEKLDESTEAEDDIFSDGLSSLIVNRGVKKASTLTGSITAPVIGRQYCYDSSTGTVSIRFYAAITDSDLDAVWTRTLYDKTGAESSYLPKGTKTSTIAYSTLVYKDSTNVTQTLAASAVQAEDGTYPYTCFVLYTLKNIPVSTLENYTIDAYVTVSNSEKSVVTKTGSVTVSSSADMDSYTLDLDMNNTYQGSNTSAGNGQYINGKVKTIYSTSDTELDTSNVIARLNSSTVTPTFSGFTAATEGTQTITVSHLNAASTYEVYVLDSKCAYKNSDGAYVVTVNPSYTGTVGTVNGTSGNMFTTISSALEFLQNSTFVDQSANKILNIAAGYYYEKLEITTPNLTINGSGTLAKGTYASDENYNADNYAAATIIEFDALYGTTDSDSFTHTTDSTQTVAIRETATNCKINGVTISNKWNCQEYFTAQSATSAVHIALALLCQADQLVMTNCALLGYQDTLELMKGRQYFNSCYISGATDFIFGTNNTTLFNACTIHSIYTGSDTNGGYINAFKGCSSGSSDYVNYGAIYSGCTFEADTDVKSGTVAIARPWGNYSAVAVIGSTIGGHVSTAAYTSGATSGARYVDMNSTPTTETVKFVEYGNTGDGAISSAVTGCTILSSTDAANYYDYSVIYAKTNGGVSYSLAWDPVNGLETDNNIYYFFNGGSSDTGTSYTFDTSTTVQGNSTTLGALTIDATSGKFAYNGSNSCQMNTGTVLSIEVAAGTTITLNAYSGYANYTVVGSADNVTMIANADTAYYYFDTAQTVSITAISQCYMISMIVNSTNQTSTATYTGVSLSSSSQDFYTGDTLDISGIKAYAVYSTGYKIDVTSSCTIDSSAVDMSTAGSYTVTYTYGETVSNLTVTVTDDVVESIAVSGQKTTYAVGADFDSTMTVKATYTSSTVVTLDSSDYTIDTSEVDLTTAGTYPVTIIYKDNTSITTSYNITVSNGEYTITFVDGSTTVSTCVGSSGTAITYPTAPDKDGYQFVRFYADSEFTTVYDETYIGEENVTVYLCYMQLNVSGVTYVSTASELVSAISSNSNIYLTADIDMTDAGYSGRTSNFTGSVYGFDYSISNWTVSNAAASTSFFGKTYAGTLKNIVFSNCSITTDANYVSILTSGSYASETIANITFNNCSVSNYSSTAANCYSGLIAGAGNLGAHNNVSDLTVTNITVNNSYVSAGQYSGGLFGYLNKGNIIVDGLYGDITFNSVGSNAKNSGGIIGWAKNYTFTLQNADVTLTVVGVDGTSQNLGGVIGGIQYNSAATGVVITDSTLNIVMTDVNKVAGGIVGMHYASSTLTISNTEIAFNISASGESIGGVAGRSAGSISLSSVTLSGTITASYRSGGVCGYLSDASATLTASDVTIGTLTITNSDANNSANTVYGASSATETPNVSGVSYDSTKVTITRGGTAVTSLQGTDTASA